MTKSVVIGAGWHPVLFRKEASQLIESCDFVHAHALVCESSQAKRLASRSSLVSEVFSPGGLVSIDNAIDLNKDQSYSQNDQERNASKI